MTGWQGEIKGASANQGKISLGPINFILNCHGLPKLPTSLESAQLAKSNTDALRDGNCKDDGKFWTDKKWTSSRGKLV